MSNPSPLVRDEIRTIAPYNSGLTLDEVRTRYQIETIAKLGSNENPLGPSPKLRSLFGDIGDLARLYPDPQGHALCSRLADSFGVDKERMILGNGSEDLIGVICRSVVRPGDRVTTLYPSFPLHEDYTILMGGTVERITITSDLTVDMDALVQAVARKPRMVMFSNPMNPVGCWLTPDQLARVIDALDPETLIVVDEAYAEYAAGDDYPSAADLLERTRCNWVVLRTFSKAYGLAGLRIGFGLVSDPGLCNFFNRVRTPFNTNAIAQASAIVALEDLDHLRKSVDQALAERARMTTALELMARQGAGRSNQPLRIAPSKGNFLFVDTGRNSTDVSEDLLKHGVIVKPWKQSGFARFIRVSVGTTKENDQFLNAFKSISEI
ncbi:histidinol-phosphate transaminase [Hoeflea sp.]|uniref:histidinol-phosphate transaminase n=1 Tax=Hoeflea sp. TaxID=1940281 RepID=UPI0037485CF8